MIRPIGVCNNEEEIKQLINEQNEIKIEKVIGLNRRWGKMTTPIKLVYLRGSLPEGVKINYKHFKVRPFVEPLLQCYT